MEKNNFNRRGAVTSQASFGSIFTKGKKAIGAVVATALLLVVAVVGVVTFQVWFTTYFSDLQTEVETQSTGGLDSRIELVIDSTLYFRNGGSENISITDIEVEGVSCNISQEISSGTQEVDIENCLSNLSTSTPEVVVYTDNSIYSEQIFVDSVSSSSSSNNESGGGNSFSQNCSSLPGNWSAVPGNEDLGTDDFCVMTYEAKDVSGTATSQPSQTPWVSINQTDARQACTDLGEGYQLITDPQWVTMARNAESQSQNWNTSTVGDGFMWTGHNDQDPNNALDVSNTSDPYDQTLDTNCGNATNGDGSSGSWVSGSSYACEGQKRTLELSTGDTVWDVGGNVWEWTNDTFTNNTASSLDQGFSGWYEWTSVTGYDYLEPSNSTFDSTNGIGQANVDTDDAYPSGTTHAFQRGGYWYDSVDAGAFALTLNRAPSLSNSALGFRCSYAQ